MGDYVLHHRLGVFQPDRRRDFVAHNQPDRRGDEDPIRVTTDQYKALADALARREVVSSGVARSSRIIRHVLASLAFVYIAVFYAAPGFQLEFSFLGDHQLTLAQISAVAPLVICYLVLHACHVGATRMRLLHECRILALELERFGAETPYSVIEEYTDWCSTTKGPAERFIAMHMYKLIYSFYDAFIFLSAGLALAGSSWLAISTYWSGRDSHPHAMIAFMLYLGVAAFLSTTAIALLRVSRRLKGRALDEYVGTIRRRFGSVNARSAPPSRAVHA